MPTCPPSSHPISVAVPSSAILTAPIGIFSTRFANVLYIEAADNYANIHYLNDDKEDTFILHNSLKDLEKEYSGMGLLRCHRGYMVNVVNVKLMRKERSGMVLELSSSSKTIPVSKSYTAAVTAFFSSDNNDISV